jgi:molecular chaperone DnaK
MKKEAEEHAEEDKKAVERMNKMNMAEKYVNTVDNALEVMPNDENINDEVRAKIKELSKNVRDALETKDADKVEEELNKLIAEWNPIAEKIYAKSKPADGQPTETGPEAETK